jgi:Rieske Fe-S protein
MGNRERALLGATVDAQPIRSVTTADGSTHIFDCFECAIHALAPTCRHCGCRIIGHGMESDNNFYCCAHCAAKEGVRGLDDRL